MNKEHPITPPPNLVQEWYHEADNQLAPYYVYMAHQAARWGADQELEACVSYVDNNFSGNKARALRAVRRPKPPSLKEQALKALDRMDQLPTAEDQHIIRRALESLPD